jgi:hypothetical protein
LNSIFNSNTHTHTHPSCIMSAPPPSYETATQVCPACKADAELVAAQEAWRRKGWWHRKTVDSPMKDAALDRQAHLEAHQFFVTKCPDMIDPQKNLKEGKNDDGTWIHTCGWDQQTGGRDNKK